MRTKFTVLFAGAMCLVATGAVPYGDAKPVGGLDDWTQYYGSADHNNLRSVQDKIGYPVVLWQMDDTYAVPAVYADKVYVPGKTLRVLDLTTGEVLHSVEAGALEEDEDARNQPRYSGTPVITGTAVIAVKSTGEVESWGLDLKKKNWTTDVSDKGKAGWGMFSPAMSGETLVLASGAVVGLSTVTGNVTWTFDPPTGRVQMAPAISNGKVYFASSPGTVYCLDLESGKEVWSVDAERKFGWTNPVVHKDVVYLSDRGAAGRRGAVNAFDAGTGKALWSQTFGATGSSTPGMGPDSIYVGFGKFVGEFDLKTGKPGSSQGYRTGINPFGTPTLVGKSLIFGNLDGNLYVFSAKSESLKWRFELKANEAGESGQVSGFAYLKKGILLVSTTQGLYAIGQRKGKKRCSPGYILTN